MYKQILQLACEQLPHHQAQQSHMQMVDCNLQQGTQYMTWSMSDLEPGR